jgi:TorA maturation chaperone TorD
VNTIDQRRGSRVHLREDPSLIEFAADALLPVHATALLRSLVVVDGICESDDSRELVVILRHCIEQDPDGVERENIRLFYGSERPQCPPWQSAYVADVHNAEALYARALQWRQRAGFGPKTTSQPADHAALLLRIYAQLLDSGADQAEIDAFHEDHLSWIPGFCQLVRSQTTHGFYRALAAWLEAEVSASSPAR